MRRTRGTATAGILLLVLIGLASCGDLSSSASPQRSPTPIPTPTAFPTPSPTLVVPSHDVTFTTSDHIQLAGTLYGHGKTFIIFSNQTDTLAFDWAPIAQQFAVKGYAALCYDYRGHGGSQGTRDLGPSLMTDLRAAIAYVRQQGAQRVVLVGASIGGAVTANVAASASVAAVAIISAPREFPEVEVSNATMARITAPKLLMDSQGDVYAQDTRAMYDAALQPKYLNLYPGRDHGLDLLTGPYGTDAMQRLIAFVQRYALASA